MYYVTRATSFMVFIVLTLDFVCSKEKLSRDQMVRNIATELDVVAKNGKLLFTMKDITWLFKKLLFENCTNTLERTKCNLCVKPREVMTWYEHPVTNISGNDLWKRSAGIIYILGEYQITECKSFFANDNTNLFNMYLKKYGSNGNILDRASIGKVIENLNKTLGYQMKEKECFSIQDVLQGANVSAKGFGKDQLNDVTTFILMKLISKTCLKRKVLSTIAVLKKTFSLFEGIYPQVLLAKLLKENGSEPNKKCCTKKDIADKISLQRGSIISERTFNDLNPEFVQAIKSEKICQSIASPQKKRMLSRQRKETWEPWIGSFICIAIISFGSLIGILAFSTKKRAYFHHVLTFLVAMGSSVLVCDSILHLIPHALGFHGSTATATDHFAPDSYLWKCFMVLIGIYIFIMLELTLSVYGFDHGHSHIHAHDGNKAVEDDKLLEMNVGEPSNDVRVKTANTEMSPRKAFSIRSIKSVAWMILIGDGLHNFMDGVAIGGVFSEPFPAGLQGGIMTSIAIFIHEVPHELGDFAVLISSGLTIKQALILNLLSSLTAFIGGIVGVILGTQWNASPWIFAITGGLFIYISLVDMLPEVRRSPLLKTSPKLALTLDFFGLAVGLIVMFLLAGYEDRLENALR